MRSVNTERTFCPQIVDSLWVTYHKLCINLWITLCITVKNVDKSRKVRLSLHF